MTIPAAILRSACLLVPAPQRTEWLAEWNGELCYIERACNGRAFSFCLGAFKDAFWFRRHNSSRWLESPAQCLLFLALISSIGLTISGRELFLSPFRDGRGLVTGHTRVPPPGAAFYREVDDTVALPHGLTLLKVVHASSNLFDVLHVPILLPGKTPVVILNREVWMSDFRGDRHIVGRVVKVNGRKVPIAAVISEDAWPLDGRVDAWVLEKRPAAVSSDFVVARSAAAAGLAAPSRRLREPVGALISLVFLACLFAPPTAVFARGRAGIRVWAFLLAKGALILLPIYSVESFAFQSTSPLMMILILLMFPTIVLSFRWAWADQRRRCPVCLRRLSDPVQFGKASHTFLDWYGMELMCNQGHGVLRVPEMATSCSGEQEWVNLDELCWR